MRNYIGQPIYVGIDVHKKTYNASLLIFMFKRRAKFM